MQLSDDILLSKIITGNAYNDNISLEEKTGKTQSKYKLHLCEVAGVYFFNKITKNKKFCYRKFTVELCGDDWIDRDDRYLYLDISYCDATKYDFLNREEILIKIRNKKNGFIFIGTLCQTKFKKILKLIKQCKYAKSIDVSTSETAEIITNEISEAKLIELGLN
jgi:hypothetical protein